ncbi:uncharacterized protein [Nothobranchius furzeri]|uniref:LOC107394285-like protein n=3 Tax=Nothobranchius TaxID=28779 RepID=A0A1A8UBX4_NOTFU|nr:putative LOC107394285-like protein [Nothobranchius furzeri]
MAYHKFRWTSEMEDQLVGLWQQRECLYKVSCRTYHNRNDKERSWAEIASALDIPVEEVKMRATSLRTQYSKILKVNPSGSGEKTLTNKQRWIMKSLMFLKKYVTQRATESTLYQPTKDAMAAEREPLSDPDDDVSQMSEETSVEEQSIPLNDDEDFSPYVSPPRPAKKPKKSQTEPKADAIEMEKLKILQQMATAFQAGRSRPSSANSDSNFGAQVAEELRLIKNPLIKTRLKRKIMNDLYEAQENDDIDARPSNSYQLPPTYPVPTSLHITNTQPHPLNTYTTPHAPPQHTPPPLTHTQLLPNHQLQNNDQICCIKLEDDD